MIFIQRSQPCIMNSLYNVRSGKVKSINSNETSTRFTMNFYQKAPRAPKAATVVVSDNLYEEIPNATKNVEEADYDHLNFHRESQKNDKYFKQFVTRQFHE